LAVVDDASWKLPENVTWQVSSTVSLHAATYANAAA
jgi:hypothetical protein